MKRPTMIDTHAHVHDPKFDDDREAMLARARAAGVEQIVTIGCDLADSRRALETAQQYDLRASVGIHPHEAVDAPADIAAAFESLTEPARERIVAVGETGLDYYYDHSPRDSQRRVLIAQLAYARERALPVVFHQRDAFDDFVGILREHFDRATMRGVIHCFTGNADQARVFTEEFGLKLGIGGVLTFKTAQALRDAVRAVGPRDLILETDCPYLAPVPYRGKRNEPAFMTQTLACAATVLERDATEIETITTANARELFRC